MERAAVLMVLLSLHSGCHGSGLPYGIPPQECTDTTIMKSSTILVTLTETRSPITTTRVVPAETEFKGVPPAWETLTDRITIPASQYTITNYIDGKDCENPPPPLPAITVTNTIPIYITNLIDPVTIYKPSKIIKWKTMKPITTTVLDTSTEIPDFKVKVVVKTTDFTTKVPAAAIVMTMPVTFTELIPAMTSTVTDRGVHTINVPAHTSRIPANTTMLPPSTHISTVIITHTTVVPADTKMQTWTVTQMINKECEETYIYNKPPVGGEFTHGLGPPSAPINFGIDERTQLPVLGIEELSSGRRT
ncbi:unnamed protein product [Meganyctiphanes norvegica]|uniref:Uncharacterized protein n=1 Tax=Meganyctiphanes norvegica TaxID=48144 RepID=A0AAV2RG84_MEGNR